MTLKPNFTTFIVFHSEIFLQYSGISYGGLYTVYQSHITNNAAYFKIISHYIELKFSKSKVPCLRNFMLTFIYSPYFAVIPIGHGNIFLIRF